MTKGLQPGIGILIGIGGFLEAGAIVTAVAAGASFRFRLLWSVLLGVVCLLCLVEMSARLVASSKQTPIDTVRERFGSNFAMLSLLAELGVDLLVLAAQIGGVCVALQLVTGIRFQWWALPVTFAIWLLLWRGTFGSNKNRVALLGLIALIFVFAAFRSQPPLTGLAAGLLPTLPQSDQAHYLFLAVAILGALVRPYLFRSYASAAGDQKAAGEHLGPSRWVARLGVGFGSVVSIALLIVAAMVLHPKGIQIDRYEQIALTLVEPFGRAGYRLFAACLAIACFGAALRVSLDCASKTGQAFGWEWGMNKTPADAARFSVVYTVFLSVAALLMMIGVDPLRLTLFAMALTAVILPLVIVPLLILMNDKDYAGEHRNSRFSNTVIVVTMLFTLVLALVAIPLEMIRV